MKRKETTGHDLLAEYSDLVAAHQKALEDLADEATARKAVVESRLSDLEAEKLVLNQLTDPPKARVARAGRAVVDNPQG